jgi:hypothetical protein
MNGPIQNMSSNTSLPNTFIIFRPVKYFPTTFLTESLVHYCSGTVRSNCFIRLNVNWALARALFGPLNDAKL